MGRHRCRHREPRRQRRAGAGSQAAVLPRHHCGRHARSRNRRPCRRRHGRRLRDDGCVLLGGETAEMPDVLTAGAVDIAGTMVGVVERANCSPGLESRPVHVLVGLESAGLHTNGYCLARKVLARTTDLDGPFRVATARRRSAAWPPTAAISPRSEGARPRDGRRPGPHHRWRLPRQPATLPA